jgi:hypothetical protein
MGLDFLRVAFVGFWLQATDLFTVGNVCHWTAVDVWNSLINVAIFHSYALTLARPGDFVHRLAMNLRLKIA